MGAARIVGDELVDDEALTRERREALNNSQMKVTNGVGISDYSRLERAGTQHHINALPASVTDHRVEALPIHRVHDEGYGVVTCDDLATLRTHGPLADLDGRVS